MKYRAFFTRTLLSFLLLVGAEVASARNSRELVFVGHEMEPFYFKEGSVGVQGAVYDIMREVCEREKLQCKFKITPFRTALEMVKDGHADVGGPFMNSAQRQSSLYFSPRIFKSKFVFLATPEVAKSVHSYPDLIGSAIVTMAPSLEWVSLQKINEVTGNKIHVSGEPSELTAIKKTENKNYGLAYVTHESATSYFRHNRSNLLQIPNLGDEFDLYLVFSKKNLPEDQFQKLNETFNVLKKSGYLKSVADKYKLQATD